MITPMSYAKAVKVSERGPKTEAQRQQAIKRLRSMARELEPYDLVAKELRRQAKTLEQRRIER